MFRSNAMVAAEDVAELTIRVSGEKTASNHVGDSGASGMAPVMVMAACNQGDLVRVESDRDGTTIYGEYQGMRTAVFAGVLISLT